MHLQKTIKKSIFFKGIGLHTGEDVEMWVHPAGADLGIIFKRLDAGVSEIPARIDYVVDSRFSTVLGINGTQIWTVEHILAALNGMGIDNACIELNGPEVPAMDGSAKAFAEAIAETGVVLQDRRKRFLALDEEISFWDDGRRIGVFPSTNLEIDYMISFSNPFVGYQRLKIELTPERFLKEIAPARTFGFLEEVNKLKTMQLAKGGGLNNAIVVGEFGIINDEGLRFKDEFVRHKILDMIGDLALLGYGINGRLFVEKGGHMLTHLFVKKILNHKTKNSISDGLRQQQVQLV